eukprot:SAG11_NODE_35175_length_268_cov_0.597633_1_plen_25_part_01
MKWNLQWLLSPATYDEVKCFANLPL